VVVGGGPGGLEAARVLAERGYHVRLFEEDQQLGGEFAAAAMVPRKEEVATALRAMITQARDQQVEIELGKRLTVEQIIELHPDAVILATGADPVRPDPPGADDARVAFAHDVLLGRRPAGQHVLVVGGGAVGMEVAEYLAVQSKTVTVVEMTERLGWGMESSHQFWVTETLRDHGAKLLTHLQLEQIAADGRVFVRDGEQKVELGPFDTIVLAVGYRPRDGLEEGLTAHGIRVFRVGDAVAPRTALEAIREGAEVAIAI
jgi:pyruvate/2-oxoglutarate dehydrogenase complex dihydrolipoamide dehydrogenase (E3) component